MSAEEACLGQLGLNNPCIMGIDPGINGGVAFYFSRHEVVAAEDLPTVDKMLDPASLARRVRQMAPDYAVIERVGAMPGQGVSSMFRFGLACGMIQGVVATLGIPYRMVSPTAWKRAMGLDSDGEKSRAEALRRWPDRSDLFARRKDHNRAEAALLAVYGATLWGC